MVCRRQAYPINRRLCLGQKVTRVLLACSPPIDQAPDRVPGEKIAQMGGIMQTKEGESTETRGTEGRAEGQRGHHLDSRERTNRAAFPISMSDRTVIQNHRSSAEEYKALIRK